MSSAGDNPFRQFVAAWEAATAVAAEWAEKTAEVTAESFRKLASDPAIRAVIQTWRITPVFARDCACPCATAHPDDIGICDRRAVITRRLTNLRVVSAPDIEPNIFVGAVRSCRLAFDPR